MPGISLSQHLMNPEPRRTEPDLGAPRRDFPGATHAFEEKTTVTWEATPDGRWLHRISPSVERIFGFPAARWFERNFWIRHVHSADRAWVMEQIAAHRGSAEPFEMNYRIVDALARSVWVRESIWMENGYPVRGTMWVGNPEAQLLGEVRATKARLHEAMSRHLQLREQVARRLGGEIHDDLGQVLTVSIRDVELLRCELPSGHDRLRRRVDRVESQLRQVLHQLRTMAATLRPPSFDEGFVVALRQHTRMVSEATGLRISLDLNEHAVPDNCDEMHLFRIVQESLSNIIRHSEATEVRVTFQPLPSGSRLEIADNGCGFEPGRPGRIGVGLATIRERVELLGGRLHIDSAPGCGTVVKARFIPGNLDLTAR